MTAKAPDAVPDRDSMRGKVRRGLVWSTASNIVLRLTNLAVGIIMARLIAPEAFGVFAVALTTWTILGSIAEFGLGADLVRRDDYMRHLPTVATLGAFLSGALAAAMFFGASAIAAGFGSPDATSTVQLMSVPLLLIGLSVVPAALLQRNIRQGTVFAIDASSLAISTILMVALAINGFGPLALAFGRIAGQLVVVILQYAAVRRWPVFGWDKSVAKEVVTFGMPLAIANLVSWLVISIDNLIVARALGPTELGLYALAFNVASWPMSVAGQSVRVIALPALSRLPSALERGRAMMKVSGPIWGISALVSLGLMFLAPQLVSVAYGDKWAGAVIAVVPLAAFGAFRVIFDLSATYLIACGMTGRVLVVQLIWLITLIPAMVIAVDTYGLAGAGWAHVAIALLVVLPAYLAAMSKAEVSPWRFVRAWLVPTVAALPLAGALWFITVSVQLKWAALCAGAAAGLLLYVLPLSKWWLATLRSLGAEAHPVPPGRTAPAASAASTEVINSG